MWLLRLYDKCVLVSATVCVALSAGCGSHEAETEDLQTQPASRVLREPLPSFESIRSVTLKEADLSDNELRDLAVLPNLKTLTLEPPLDDESVAILASLPGLRKTLDTIHLKGPQFTNESVRSVAAFKELTRLDLVRTSVDDTGVAAIASMDLKLEVLLLSGSPVTDAAIPHLQKMKHLESLDIQVTDISDQGTYSLMQAMPEVWVGNSHGIPNDESNTPYYFRIRSE